MFDWFDFVSEGETKNRLMDSPTPSIQHIVNKSQRPLLVGQFERVAYDFCAWIRGFDLVDQAREVVCWLRRAGVHHSCSVSGEFVDDGAADRVGCSSHYTDEAVL